MAVGVTKTQVDEVAEAQTPNLNLELHFEEIYEEVIDGEVLFAFAYRDPVTRLVRPPLFVTEGATNNLNLVNTTRRFTTSTTRPTSMCWIPMAGSPASCGIRIPSR
jgi:hypothetical protein